MKINSHNTPEFLALSFHFSKALEVDEVDTMAEQVELAMEKHQTLRLLLDFRDTQTINPSAFASVKGSVISAKSIGPIERYAVVAAPAIAAAMVEGFGKLLPLKAQSFDHTDYAKAESWILEAP